MTFVDWPDSSKFLLSRDGAPANQSSQPRLRRFVILVLVTVIIILIIVVATIYKINHQNSSFTHSIQLETGFEHLISIKNAGREVQINLSLFQRKADFSEMLMMGIRHFILSVFRPSAIEDQNAFTKRQAEQFSTLFRLYSLDCCH